MHLDDRGEMEGEDLYVDQPDPDDVCCGWVLYELQEETGYYFPYTADHFKPIIIWQDVDSAIMDLERAVKAGRKGENFIIKAIYADPSEDIMIEPALHKGDLAA